MPKKPVFPKLGSSAAKSPQACSWPRKAETRSSKPLLFKAGSQDHGFRSPELTGYIVPGLPEGQLDPEGLRPWRLQAQQMISKCLRRPGHLQTPGTQRQCDPRPGITALGLLKHWRPRTGTCGHSGLLLRTLLSAISTEGLAAPCGQGSQHGQEALP